MADVQIDSGNFTQIANILLEKVSSAKLNGCQNAIILQVWRYTYGFKRKEHELSSGFIAKGTGYNKRQIEREIKALVKKNILFQQVVDGVSRTLQFNKDFDLWVTPGELADGQEADGKSTDGQEADTPPARKPAVTPGELAGQERKSFKENLKQTQEEEPRTAMDAYIFSFKKMQYTGHISKYVMDLMGRGFTDTFIREVFMEMGARGISADERYMRKLAEDWIMRGIYTRVQAEQAKEEAKKSNTVPFQQQPKKTGIPDMNETQAHLDEITRLQELKRKRIAERTGT